MTRSCVAATLTLHKLGEKSSLAHDDMALVLEEDPQQKADVRVPAFILGFR